MNNQLGGDEDRKCNEESDMHLNLGKHRRVQLSPQSQEPRLDLYNSHPLPTSDESFDRIAQGLRMNHEAQAIHRELKTPRAAAIAGIVFSLC
jgi:hypothetical protein